MKYIVDIDGTICTWEKDGCYENAQPFKNRIEVINRLYDDGWQSMLLPPLKYTKSAFCPVKINKPASAVNSLDAPGL